MGAIRNVLRPALAAAALTAGHALAVDYSVNVIRYIDPATGTPAAFTQLWGNNNNGKVAGIASMSGDLEADGFSFVYDPAIGAFSRLPTPTIGAVTDYTITSINDADAIAGTYFDGLSERGFLERAGTYSLFAYPGYPNTEGGRTISSPTAVHPHGLVVGFAFDDSLADPLARYRGFVYDPSSAAFFTLPTPPSTFTIAQGLNIAGQIVGNVQDPAVTGSSALQGFLYTPTTPGEPMFGGTVTTFQIGGFGTRARGINDHGVLAAAVNDVPGTATTHAYVGTAVGPTPGYQRIEMPGVTGGPCPDGSWPEAFPEGLNNAGQVTGIYVDSTCATAGFIATPAYVPNGTTPAGAYTFSVDVVPNVPVFLDPAVAIAYDYELGKKDPRFASVRLPLGIGNNKFVLVVGGKAYDLPAGQLFTFADHGYKKGVKAFRVACIDPAALLDPVNSLAFPTEVTFADAGRFTGTQMPLTRLRDHGGIDLSMTQAQCRERLLKAERVNGPPAE